MIRVHPLVYGAFWVAWLLLGALMLAAVAAFILFVLTGALAYADWRGLLAIAVIALVGIVLVRHSLNRLGRPLKASGT